jgi:hypothetical protein
MSFARSHDICANLITCFKSLVEQFCIRHASAGARLAEQDSSSPASKAVSVERFTFYYPANLRVTIPGSPGVWGGTQKVLPLVAKIGEFSISCGFSKISWGSDNVVITSVVK